MAKHNVEFPAVLFDLDGTLIDSVYEHVQAWWETLRDVGIIVPKWRIHRRIGMSGKSFIEELLREFGHKRKRIDLDKLEQRHDTRLARAARDLHLLPGANQLLQHL